MSRAIILLCLMLFILSACHGNYTDKGLKSPCVLFNGI